MNGKGKAPIFYSIEELQEISDPLNQPSEAQSAQFAQFAHSAYHDKENDLSQTKTIPDEVYENLPEILKRCCSVFDDQREKDVFLTGALGVLSGCFNKVKGLYNSDEYYPNLNIFIVAPSASGKGSMKYSKILGNAIHAKKKNSSKGKKLQIQKQKNNVLLEPPQHLLFIPANTSSSAVTRHLSENDESGIICETEADTMAETFKQDWGGYSDLIRKAFHHEPVSYSRKKDREFIELENPKLSVVLSGTPDQVRSLIHSSENGLFSRIIFYVFDGIDLWRNVRPKEIKLNKKEFFQKISIEVKAISDPFSSKDYEFDLTEEQWISLDSQFSSWLNEITTFINKDTASIIKRLGIVQFRIAMILSILRHYEVGEKSRKIVCSDIDFRSAQLLSDVYLEHGLTMFFKLPGERKLQLNNFIRKFYDLLPVDKEFARSDAVKIGLSIRIKERSVDNYLKRLLEINFLTQPEYGKYRRI